jgi:hypothetical protein
VCISHISLPENVFIPPLSVSLSLAQVVGCHLILDLQLARDAPTITDLVKGSWSVGNVGTKRSGGGNNPRGSFVASASRSNDEYEMTGRQMSFGNTRQAPLVPTAYDDVNSPTSLSESVEKRKDLETRIDDDEGNDSPSAEKGKSFLPSPSSDLFEPDFSVVWIATLPSPTANISASNARRTDGMPLPLYKPRYG